MRITWSPLKRAMFYYVVWNRHIEQVITTPLLPFIFILLLCMTMITLTSGTNLPLCHLDGVAVRGPPVPYRIHLSPGRMRLGEVRRSFVQRAKCTGGNGGPCFHDDGPRQLR